MDGAAKTATMLGVCTSGAANLVDAYTTSVMGVVYEDWFLPSKGELKQMYINRDAIGVFSEDRYWSSSEYSAGFAWLHNFGPNRNPESVIKSNNYLVRPVRAF
jgi:hypothetical protein